MKREDVYNGMTGIRSEYLEEAEAYKVTKVFRWKRWVAVAACFCLLVLGSVSLFPGQKPMLPFVMTAYAMEAEGEMKGALIEINQATRMTRIELSTGKGGFLFSVDLKDGNDESRLIPFVFDVELRRGEIEEVRSNYIEKKGKAYFYFVPDEDVNADDAVITTLLGCTKVNGTGVVYKLQIIKDKGTFYAQLTEEKEYPDGTEDTGMTIPAGDEYEHGKDVFCDNIEVQNDGTIIFIQVVSDTDKNGD